MDVVAFCGMLLTRFNKHTHELGVERFPFPEVSLRWTLNKGAKKGTPNGEPQQYSRNRLYPYYVVGVPYWGSPFLSRWYGAAELRTLCLARVTVLLPGLHLIARQPSAQAVLPQATAHCRGLPIASSYVGSFPKKSNPAREPGFVGCGFRWVHDSRQDLQQSQNQPSEGKPAKTGPSLWLHLRDLQAASARHN